MKSRDFEDYLDEEEVGGFKLAKAKKTSFSEFNKHKPFDDGLTKERNRKQKSFSRPREEKDNE